MAGFSRSRGTDRGYRTRTIASLALAVGDLVTYDRSAAKVIKATSSATPESIAGVVVTATTTSDTEVLLQQHSEFDEYVVDSNSNSDSAHNYQRLSLTDENTVNNGGSDQTDDTGVVTQVGTVGAVGDKKIIVEFVTRMVRAA